MTDLYLEKVQAFTENNCFGRSVTSWNYIILYELKKIHEKKVTLKYLGRSKALKFKNQKNKYNWLLPYVFTETNKRFG